MRWCCNAIQQQFEARKKRGIAVVAVPPNELHPEPRFQLSLRSIDDEVVRKVQSPLAGEYVAQTLQTWAPIKYCPWCGVELRRFYRKTWDALYDESELSSLERQAN
ncbi:hypothetical protein [Botrimarina sp.]|uniref:hypothetical protein n=1 Tax=Botrimarina sp. TaxID=2795802 RepID=UPI0032EE6216